MYLVCVCVCVYAWNTHGTCVEAREQICGTSTMWALGTKLDDKLLCSLSHLNDSSFLSSLLGVSCTSSPSTHNITTIRQLPHEQPRIHGYCLPSVRFHIFHIFAKELIKIWILFIFVIILPITSLYSVFPTY